MRVRSVNPVSTRVLPRTRRGVLGVSVALALTLGVVACGSDEQTQTPDVPTVTPATAQPAPESPTAAPRGHVLAVPGESRSLASVGSAVAVLDAEGTSVRWFADTAPGAQAAVISTPELITIEAGADGIVGVGPGVLVSIDADGTNRQTDIDVTDPSALALTADGRILVGTSSGTVKVIAEDGRIERSIPGFVRVDEITVSPEGADTDSEQVIVLDRAQSSVTPVNIDDGSFGAALRAGNGATNAIVDHYGRILVANTRDGEIMAFFGTPLVNRFRHPVTGGPFDLAYDDTRDLLYVTTTGTNETLAFDLATGEPTERLRFPTVAQPDHIAVDDASGTVFVLSGRDAGLQVIPPQGDA